MCCEDRFQLGLQQLRQPRDAPYHAKGRTVELRRLSPPLLEHALDVVSLLHDLRLLYPDYFLESYLVR
jgi:hypothetical protein